MPPGLEEAHGVYDAWGRLLESRDGSGNALKARYDDAKRALTLSEEVSSNDPTSPTSLTLSSRHELDSLGRLVRLTNPAGNALYFDYDSRGLLSKAFDALGPPSAETYDNTPGSPRINERGNQTELLRDSLGRIVTTKMKLTTTDESGRTAPVPPNPVNPENQILRRWTYSDEGRLLTVTDMANNTHTLRYDDTTGRLREVEFPASQASGGKPTHKKVAYDDAGRIEVLTREDGTELKFAYKEGLLRDLSIVGTDEGSVFEYDDEGVLTRIVEKADPGSSTALEFDSVGNVVEERITIAGTQYASRGEYDGSGRLIKETRPSGDTVQYGYDDATGLPTDVSNDDGTLARFYYLGGSLLHRKEILGNNTVFAHDDRGLLEDRRVHGLDGGLARTTYKHDRLHRVIEETSTYQGNVLTKKYVYDSAHRVIQEETSSTRGGASDVPPPAVPLAMLDLKPLAVPGAEAF